MKAGGVEGRSRIGGAEPTSELARRKWAVMLLVSRFKEEDAFRRWEVLRLADELRKPSEKSRLGTWKFLGIEDTRSEASEETT